MSQRLQEIGKEACMSMLRIAGVDTFEFPPHASLPEQRMLVAIMVGRMLGRMEAVSTMDQRTTRKIINDQCVAVSFFLIDASNDDFLELFGK